MSVSKDFLDFALEQLAPFGTFEIRRMFSGVGMFRDGLMFAIAMDDVLYLKVDDENRSAFVDAGSAPFSRERDGKTRNLGYYEVPAEVLEEPVALAEWARQAFAAALRAARKKTAGARRPPPPRAAARKPRPRR